MRRYKVKQLLAMLVIIRAMIRLVELSIELGFLASLNRLANLG